MHFGMIKGIPKSLVGAVKLLLFNWPAPQQIEENSQIQGLCLLVEAHSTGLNYHGLCSLLEFTLVAILMISITEPV